MADPVAVKELRGFARRWQTYVGRCLFVGLTGYLLYQYWRDVWAPTAGQPPTSVSEAAELARGIFVRCEWATRALAVVAAVIVGSDMIAKEVRGGTLGILFLSSLTPARVVLGKWKAVMMVAVALFLCGVPVQAIAVYLGGVGPADLARSAAYSLGLTAVAGAVAIYFSARLKSAGAAVAASLPLLLALMGLFSIADALGTWAYHRWIAPKAIVHDGGVATSVTAILLVVTYLLLAIARVRRRVRDEPASEDVAREMRALRLEDVRDRRPRKERRLLTTWRAVWEGNPLLWKEFTLRPALRVREDYRARAYILLFTMFLVTWVISAFKGSHAFPIIWGAFFTIVALAGGSLLFAPEKEGKQWLLLLSTPISAAQVIRAKLLCGLIFPEAAGLILIYLLAMAAWLCQQTIFTFLTVGGILSLFLLFAYALAASASLRSRTARGAFLFAGGVVATLLTLPPLLAAAARPAGLSPGELGHEVWCWIEAFNPLSVLEALEVVGGAPRTMPALGVDQALRFVFLYLPVTILLPVEMVWRFRRIAIRA